MRARARYQATASLWLPGQLHASSTTRIPTADIQYDFRSRDNSLAVFWTPGGGKRISVMAEYDRSTLHSSINYLLLPFFTPSISVYRDNAHTATFDDRYRAAGDRRSGGQAHGRRIAVHFVGHRGRRATTSRWDAFRCPLQKHVQWNTEWRWYGFGEQFYLYEGFRTHTFMTGLRVSK